MPKLLKSKSLKKQKTLDELHKEITKNLGYFDLPMSDTPNSDFEPETYEEWLEEMEYEESLMTQKEKDEAKKREQKFWSMMKQLYPERFKGFSA